MVAATFLSIFARATGAFLDSDTWWHLRAGEWMVAHGRILARDEFSWTRFGHPWVNHSWLAEIPMYLVWRTFGFGGLDLAVAGIVTLMFVFVYRQTEGSVYLRTVTVLLAALASSIYWLVRPELVSLLLTAGFAYSLHRFRYARINHLWVLPVLMVAWVNLHAGFIAGFLLLGGTLAGQIGSRALGLSDEGVLPWRGVRQLAWTGLACAVVALLNPYGPQILLYPFQTASIPALGNFIQEWMSPNFHLAGMQPFIGLLFLTFAAIGLSGKRVDLTDLVLCLGFAYLALIAARNIALFALIAPPVLTRHAAVALQKVAERRRSLAAILDPRAPSRRPTPAFSVLNWGLLAALLAVVLAKGMIAFRTPVNELAVQNGLPVGAVDAIRKTQPPGPMFNPDDWGGYLIWTLYPRYRVYIDGRIDLYGDAFVREYLRVLAGQEEWRTLFDQMGIRLVIVYPAAPLAATLRRDPGWTQTYGDSTASVFVRH